MSGALVRIGLLETDPLRMIGVQSAFERWRDVRIIVMTLESILTDAALSLAILPLFSSSDSEGTIQQIRNARPSLDLLVLSDQPAIQNAAALAGPKCYLTERAPPGRLLRNARAILALESGSHSGKRAQSGADSPCARLTQREREVLRLLISASSNREIAEALSMKESTVKGHIARLMRKVGVENRTALTVIAARKLLSSAQ